MLERPITGIALARKMFERHYLNLVTAGVIWVGDKGADISPQRKTQVLEKAAIFKKKIVEQALADRKSALARGGQPDLSEEIIQWMVELNVFDDTFNPRPALDFSRELTEALKRANRDSGKGGVAVAEK